MWTASSHGCIERLRQLKSLPGELLLDWVLWLWQWTVRSEKPSAPQHIFILRNNDLGDLLIITPLFAALKQRHPHAKISVGVGDWNVPVLQQNPYVDRVIPINAPWHNKQVLGSVWQRWRYLFTSPEIAALRKLNADVGIDVFGSAWGVMLLLRAGIPYRLGVRGYAGGAIALQDHINYDSHLQVGTSALRFATLLGTINQPSTLPPARPQVTLTTAEQSAAAERWQTLPQQSPRILIGPGSGQDDRYWPLSHYQTLVAQLVNWQGATVVLVGGKGDRAACEQITQAVSNSPYIWDWTGQLGLRQTFALAATADLVICNSSMLMHAAAAFCTETLVLLGEAFTSRQQHDAQWGYDAHYHSLGKEPGMQTTIASPTEAIVAIKRLLSQ